MRCSVLSILLLQILQAIAQNSKFTVLGHDQIKHIEDPRSENPFSLVKRFQPYMTVTAGCVPFPAVDAQGHVSGGLQSSGGLISQCAHSIGQTYVRIGAHAGKVAIMYAWYFPKTHMQEIMYLEGNGHRHLWLNMIVWLNTPFDLEGLYISYSSTYHYLEDKSYGHTGSAPWIVKDNDQLKTDVNAPGFLNPLVSWDNMPEDAKNTLNYYDFAGDNHDGESSLRIDEVECPFNERYFKRNLARAWFARE